MSIQNDLNFLATLAKSFFKQAHIRKTLAAIKEEEITGWEKWLQIEFATFLRSHDSVKEWNREIQHSLDKRIAKSRSACAIDFVILQKHKHSTLALEIKQRSSMTACLRGMLRDIKKVGKIKEKQFNSRGIGVWVSMTMPQGMMLFVKSFTTRVYIRLPYKNNM
jgi:hypothetical protein